MTSEGLQPLTQPGDDYLKVIVRALKKETGLNEKEIAHYLWDFLRYGKNCCCGMSSRKVAALVASNPADAKGQ